MPTYGSSWNVVRLFDAPEFAAVPAESAADGCEGRSNRLVHRLSAGESMLNRFLYPQETLGALAVGQILDYDQRCLTASSGLERVEIEKRDIDGSAVGGPASGLNPRGGFSCEAPLAQVSKSPCSAAPAIGKRRPKCRSTANRGFFLQPGSKP